MEKTKGYKVKISRENGNTNIKYFTKDSLKQYMGCFGYVKEPFCDLYITEYDNGIRFLEILEVFILIEEWS